MLFFFQAEDGIRDLYVTGVQTCALRSYEVRQAGIDAVVPCCEVVPELVSEQDREDRRYEGEPRTPVDSERSEERRVGKEGNEGGEACSDDGVTWCDVETGLVSE